MTIEQSVPVEGTRSMRALVAGTLRHADEWGMVWFGTIFWGSVGLAAARRLWPDASSVLLAVVTCTLGLLAGLAARRRGYWL